MASNGTGRGGRGRGRRGGRGVSVVGTTRQNTARAVAEQSRATIIDEQWDNFHQTMERYYEDNEDSLEQQRFLAELFSDGQLKLDAHFTFQMIVHEMSALIELEEDDQLTAWKSLDISEKKESLLSVVSNLVRVLEARQADLHDVPEEDSQRYLFRWLEMHEDSFSMRLLINIGMCLGFRYKPKQTSWWVAGKSYILGQMCLHLHLCLDSQNANNDVLNTSDTEDSAHGMTEADDNDDALDAAPLQQNVVHSQFVPNSLPAAILKLCVFSVWNDKYTNEQNWSLDKMLGAWLQEGLTVYTEYTNNTSPLYFKKPS